MSIQDQHTAPTGSHKALVNAMRKDSKFKVEYILSGGSRFNKLQNKTDVQAMIDSQEYNVTLYGTANYIFKQTGAIK